MKKKTIFILILGLMISSSITLNVQAANSTSASKQTSGDEDFDTSKEKKALETKIKNAEEQYKKQEGICKKRFVVMYKTANVPKVETFLRSKNLFEFYKSTYIMSIISKKDSQMLRDLELSKKELETAKKMKEDLEKGISTASVNEKNIDSIMSANTTVKKEISNRKRVLDYYKNNLDAMEKSSREIDDYIKGINAGEVPPSDIVKWPVPSCHKISSYFEDRINPVTGIWEKHDGLDIPAEYGASVVAAGDGRVEQSGWYGGFGYTIIINHGAGIFTLYGHNISLVVNKGDMVSSGQVISKVGSTGVSTGNHSHFTVKKNGISVDPLGYVEP